MVGKKQRSGNPNSFIINPDASLGTFFRFLAGNRKQGISTWAIHCLLEYNLEEAKKFFSAYPDILEQYRKKYKKQIFEQMQDKREKQAEAEARRKRKEAREDLALKVRAENTANTREWKIKKLENEIWEEENTIKANTGEIEVQAHLYQHLTPEQLEARKKQLETLKLQLASLKEQDKHVKEDVQKIIKQETGEIQ